MLGLDQTASLESLVDRQGILDCLSRLSRGMDRFDRDLVMASFHPDAICDYGPYVGGAAGLFDWAEDLGKSAVCTHHHLSNHTCEISGTTAHCETYLLYNVRRCDGTLWQAHGRYLDRLEKRDGQWRIAMRYCVIEAAGTFGETEMPFERIEDIATNGAPANDRTDPSYRRPLTNRRVLRGFGE